MNSKTTINLLKRLHKPPTMHSQGCNLISGCYKNSQIVVKGSRLTQIMLHNTPKRNWVQKKLTDCNLISSGCKVQGFRNDCPHLPSEGDESATVATGPKWTDEYQQKWPRTLVQNEPAGCNSLPTVVPNLSRTELKSRPKINSWNDSAKDLSKRSRFIKVLQTNAISLGETKKGRNPTDRKMRSRETKAILIASSASQTSATLSSYLLKWCKQMQLRHSCSPTQTTKCEIIITASSGVNQCPANCKLNFQLA